ncbi:YncE family protein [Pantoea stewartii]|uniref:YncE family protein n=1 Tax=Pantoea stewartii TaxID=66269 RepID=UPI0023FA1939|nr:YncE family protein [Pantoea stewartii]MDF7788169.1 YncE family protein [Pantoea stewartii]
MSFDSRGLLAIDRQTRRALFLDPDTFAVSQAVDVIPTRLHELLMLAPWGKAFLPLYGDAMRSELPHPGHKVAVIDLRRREITDYIDLSPSKAPHSGQLGRDGKVYLCCENPTAVVVIDPQTYRVEKTIPIPLDNTHRLTLSPSGRKLFTDNEQDATITVVDLCEAEGRVIDTVLMPGPVSGLTASPKHPYLIASAADAPLLYVVDRQSHRIRQRLALPDHQHPCQKVRFSPDGDYLMAMGDQEPTVTLFDELLNPLGRITLAGQPLDGCFSPDKKKLLITHDDNKTLSVIDLMRQTVVVTAEVGAGYETLSYFQID